MGFPNARKQAMLDSEMGSGTPATLYVAALTTMPDEAGAGAVEPTIGVGGYARIAVTNNATNFPAASSASGVASKKMGTAQSFPGATGTWGFIRGFAIYDASTAGNLRATARAIKNRAVISAVDTATETLTSTAHGLTANMEVQFDVIDGSLPAGLAVDTVYYVIAAGLTANDFRVSATLGGAAINLTSVGSGAIAVFRSFAQTIVNQNTLTIQANELDFQFRTAF